MGSTMAYSRVCHASAERVAMDSKISAASLPSWAPISSIRHAVGFP